MLQKHHLNHCIFYPNRKPHIPWFPLPASPGLPPSFWAGFCNLLLVLFFHRTLAKYMLLPLGFMLSPSEHSSSGALSLNVDDCTVQVSLWISDTDFLLPWKSLDIGCGRRSTLSFSVLQSHPAPLFIACLVGGNSICAALYPISSARSLGGVKLASSSHFLLRPSSH